MSKWNEICSNVSKAANKTIKKTEELAETASMHVKLSALKSKKSELYEKLGKLTYKQLKSGEEKAGEIAKLVIEIDNIKVQIAEQKEKIEKVKEEKKKAKEEKKKEKAAAQKQEEDNCVAEVQVIIDSNK